MSDASVAAKPLERGSGPPKMTDGVSWTASLFVVPAVVLLGIFLLYPTISTIILSFENGLDNYIRLFTRDPNFFDVRRFPPTGAFWNNVLWVIFYTGGCVFFGLLIAVMAARVRYEAFIKAIVFLPQAIAATALGVIWRFVYFPSEQTGLLNAGARRLRHRPHRVARQRHLGQHLADHRRHLGIGRLRDRHPVGRAEGDQHRDPRGGTRRRRP